ncbi:ribonuclease H-like domain-containing protein [Tanacetum coccineum]
MDLENTQNNSLAKLSLLKQGEYDTWRLRIESYIQLQDYTLWEITEEGKETLFKASRVKLGLEMQILPTEWVAMFVVPGGTSHSSTNDDNIANVHVSTGSSPVSTASTNNSTACLSDATVYAYLATQPNGSQVVHEDLEQIHEDDLDEIDLKNPKSQENRSRSQDSSRRTVNMEEASPKAILAIDGTGFDWSYMAQEEASTNFALMAFPLILRFSTSTLLHGEELASPGSNSFWVYEDEMKRSSSSTSTSQNLAFLSSKNTSSTNEVSTASGDFGHARCLFSSNPTTSPQLENEDFQQIVKNGLVKTNESNTQKPKTFYESVNKDKVIIKDWNSDDEDDVSEVQTVSPVKNLNESQNICAKKGIKREFSMARTPQQNGVAERKNMTLIEAARQLYSEDDKEGQHQMTEDEQVLHDDLEKIMLKKCWQKALVMPQRPKIFEEEKRNVAS